MAHLHINVNLNSVCLLICAIIVFFGISTSVAQIQFPFEENKLIEGSVCRFNHNGSLGVCTHSTRCPVAALELNQWQIQPTTCSLDKNYPIVCCYGQSNGIPSYPQLPTDGFGTRPPVLRPPTNNYVKRASAHWCETSYSMRFAEPPREQFDFHTTLVGGSPTKSGEFPHMVAIGWVDDYGMTEWKCGGSLISEKFVLTAAHCTSSRNVRPKLVRIGEENLLESAPISDTSFEIAEIIVHPEYRAPIYYYDIALLKLNGVVSLRWNLRPACLWQSPTVNVTDVIATGYGTTSFGGRSEYKLQKVNLRMYDTSVCTAAFTRDRTLPEGIVEEGQICAGDTTGQRDTCQGDSGGPLQIHVNVNGQNVYHIIGVTSFGMACASPVPGIYTRVSTYLDWIERHVWP